MSLYQRHYADMPTGAGGEATLGEIYEAAEFAGRTLDNVNSPEAALEEAYAKRIEAIEAATGERLEHPRDRALRSLSSRFPLPWKRAAAMDDIPAELDAFDTEMRALAEKHPEAKEAFALDVPFQDQARQLAAEAESDLDRLSGSRAGIAKYGALFAGGSVAAIQDPVQTPLLLLGAGPGAARTVAGRIGSVAVKEALINGSSEAGLQPFVQKWRKEVGLESGLDQALEQILFSTAFGGAFGGGARAIGEGGHALGRYLKDRQSPVASAIEGDIDAIFDLLSPARNDLPADARGALDAIEADRLIRTERRKGVDPEIHDGLTARALDDLQADAPSNRLGEGLDAQRRVGARDDADIVATGPHGPILDRVAYQGNWPAAVSRLQALQDGEIPGALFHNDVGDIDVIWGDYSQDRRKGKGLSKLLDKHPEVVPDLPRIMRDLDVLKATNNRVELGDGRYKAVVRLDFDGNQKTWLLTAFDDSLPPSRSTRRGKESGSDAQSSDPAGAADISATRTNVETVARGEADALGQYSLPLDLQELDRMPELTSETPADLANTQTQRLLDDADLQEEFPLMQIVDADGRVVAGSATLAEALDEADRGAHLADIVEACKVDR